MANNSRFGGSTPGYSPTNNNVGKGDSVPALATGDTADNKERGNITLAAEQKKILTRANAGDVRNSEHNKYKY